MIRELAITDFPGIQEKSSQTQVWDVRDAKSFAEGHIVGAVNKPIARTHSSTGNMGGWWKVPAADIPELPKATSEVGLPSTRETLLLRNLLQGKITARSA